MTFPLQFFLAQMSSLSTSSSAIYSSTLSNHIYLSVDIILVYLKVVMHQGSVLSPPLFGVVMDVVVVLLYALFNHPRLLIQVALVQKAQFSYRLYGLVP